MFIKIYKEILFKLQGVRNCQASHTLELMQLALTQWVILYPFHALTVRILPPELMVYTVKRLDRITQKHWSVVRKILSR